MKATELSCKAAFKFINAVYHSKTGTPEHYKCKLGKAKEPRGYFPQVCTKAPRRSNTARRAAERVSPPRSAGALSRCGRAASGLPLLGVSVRR